MKGIQCFLTMHKQAIIAVLKLTGALKYIFLVPLAAYGQTVISQSNSEDSCALYRKYTLGMEGLGNVEHYTFVENGKQVSIEFIDFLIPMENITLINKDSGTYLIKYLDFPKCREVSQIFYDKFGSIIDAKNHGQVRVMLMLEMRKGKKTWKLGKYHHQE